MEEKLAEYRRQRSTQYTKVKTAAQIAQRKEEFNLLDYVPFSSLIQKILNRVSATPFAQRIAEKLRWLSKITGGVTITPTCWGFITPTYNALVFAEKLFCNLTPGQIISFFE